MTRAVLHAAALAASLMLPALPASAQQQAFPSRLVTLVVPFTAGSGSDTIARIIAPVLSAKWGQPVVVDNRPGASGNIGSQYVARATPDGHTLLMAINTHTITPAIYKTLPFDPVRDFTPVGKLAEANFTLALNPSAPMQDVKSMITYAKANPGKLNYASPGNGTPQHMAMELLKSTYGVDIVHVPYKGISGALTDLMGGQVQMMFASVPSVRTHAEARRVKLVAVTGEGRHALIPEVPTFREQGYEAMDVVDAWYGVLGPAKMPAELSSRINKDLGEAMNSESVKSELTKQGLVVRTGTPEQLATLIRTDMARWQKVVATAGITAE